MTIILDLHRLTSYAVLNISEIALRSLLQGIKRLLPGMPRQREVLSPMVFPLVQVYR